MKFEIAYDKYTRLRVRCREYLLSPEQACGLESAVLAFDCVTLCKVNYKTGSILVEYTKGGRSKIVDYLKNLKVCDIKEKEVSPIVRADQKFYKSLEKAVAVKFLMRFVPAPIRYVMTIYKGAKYVLKGLDSLLQCNMNVSVLDATSIGISLVQKNFKSASYVMFLLQISELLEDYTRERTKLALSEQLALNIDYVWLSDNGTEIKVPFSEVQVGDKVVVRAGNVIPFDGTVCDSEAMVNQATMTGESQPVHKKDGDSVFTGTTVEMGEITVCVRSLSYGSRLQKIIGLIDESENLKAGIQSRAEHLADAIVPYSFPAFFLALALTGSLRRALCVLMVDFSCAIKLSTPVSVISAMREVAETGALVKGGKYLEILSEADAIVFDKTGTLTNANPEVTDVIAFNGFERDYVLRTAACLEEHFPHSVAAAVVNKAREEGLLHEEEHAKVEYLVAHGIATDYNGKRAIIGSGHFVFADENVPLSDEQKQLIEERADGNSAIFLAIGGVLAGMLLIDDPVRDNAKTIIHDLRKLGIGHICMLTGDSEAAAKRVSESLGLDMYRSQVLPEDKSSFVKELQEQGHKVIMVGDGVNDTPALAAADVSVAMCGGSDIAREVADISLCEDDIANLVTLRKLSMELMKRISGNYRFIVGFNAGLIVSGVAGIISPTTSALLHNTSTMLISAKSMTKLIKK